METPIEVLNQYRINMGAVFTIKPFQKLYIDFLKTEKSLEIFEFLLSVNSLTSTRKKGPQEIKKAISIKKEFLEEGAEKQLNIESTLRFEILQKFEESKQEEDLKNWRFNEEPEELFDNIWRNQWVTLHFDKKSRFIRTPEFVDFALKNLKNEELLTKKPLEDLKYTVKDFHLPIWTEKDKKFNTALDIDNYDWDLFYKKNGTYCYYTMRDYLPNVPAFHPSESMCLKWIWTVPYSLEDVLRVHFHDIESFRKTTPGFTHYDLQGVYTNEEQQKLAKENNIHEEIDNNGVIHHAFQLITPGAMANVIAPLICTLYLEGKDVVYGVKYATSIRENQIPLRIQKGEYYIKKDKKVEAEYAVIMILGQYRFTEIDQNLTRVSCTGIQNYSIKELDMEKYSKKMGEMRGQSLKSNMVKDMKTFLPDKEYWTYEDFQGKMLLKVLEEYNNRVNQ
jgi:hypothetical protein